MILPTGNGIGLSAQYFKNVDLTNAGLSRIDKTVDFKWGHGSPSSLISNTNFSARWLGKVQAKSSGSYNFYTNSDDGIRLWVNGKQLVNNWTDHPAIQNKGTIDLVSGQKYNIKIEYYQRAGDATVQLSWESKGIIKQIIPQSQLYSNGILSSVPITIVPIVAPIALVPIKLTFDPAFHDSDQGVPNEAKPDGVPNYYSWYSSAAQPGWMNNPRTDWHSITDWGQVYAVENWHPEQAPNTLVQVRDDQLWILSKSTGKWSEYQYPGINGGAFRSDYGNNGGRGVTTKDESSRGGGIGVTAGNGFNYHFWSGYRANIDPTDIAGIYTIFQARLIQDDLSKPDDRSSAHYIASAGADYWRSQNADWLPDFSNN